MSYPLNPAVCKGHAGTVPMSMRKDPLVTAANIVLWINSRCGGKQAQLKPPGLPKDHRPADGLVCTVGSLTLWPGAGNVIPGSVIFTVDIRWGLFMLWLLGACCAICWCSNGSCRLAAAGFCQVELMPDSSLPLPTFS